MGKGRFRSNCHASLLCCSVILNLLLITNIFVGGQWKWSWSWRATEEAEAVAAVLCSGHGRAYLDGLVVDERNQPLCECTSACFTGSDCSQLLPDCLVDADSGDPLFLEPFWLQHAGSSALVVSGWHRMSYDFIDGSPISKELERLIRKLHAIVGNAVTENRFIVFGAGSTQVLNAAVYALSMENTSSPTGVVASVPYYALYKQQAEYFNPAKFEFQGDAHTWSNRSDRSTNMIEIVTSPNNPDGKLNQPILHGPNVKTIYDYAYYWPHFTPIPAPADEDLMVFTLSKLTGHAGSRFGWALIKDENVYNRMLNHMRLNSIGVSKDTQLRAFKLLKAVLEGDGGREIFEFGYHTMNSRWERLINTLSLSNRFSLQKIRPQYCNFYNKVKKFSPAYAWLKCEREEDKDCYAVLKAAQISGRNGTIFGTEDRYVRLSMVRNQDDFDMLIQRLNKLVSDEQSVKTI